MNEIIKKKLAYPCDKFNYIKSFNGAADRQAKDFFSTLEHSNSSNREVRKTNEIIGNYL